MLLRVVDDRALEVARRRCRARRGPRGRPPGRPSPGAVASSTRFCEHLVELEQVLQLALEVRALGAVRRGADDRAAAAEVELLGLLAQALALLVVEAPRDADALAGGRVDHVAPGDGQLHRQPRALGLQRVLDDLHDDLLAGLEQVGDRRAAAPCRGRAAASRRPAARSRRRAGSRSCRGRCRRTRPPGRAGRCRPCPCRCCRRSSGCRGARGRARRRGSRRRRHPACGGAAWPACGARVARRLQQRDAGLPAVDADQHLLLHGESFLIG